MAADRLTLRARANVALMPTKTIACLRVSTEKQADRGMSLVPSGTVNGIASRGSLGPQHETPQGGSGANSLTGSEASAAIYRKAEPAR